MIQIHVAQHTSVNVAVSTALDVDVSTTGTVIVQTGDAPAYSGPYSVRPEVEAQSLPTAGHLMRQDLEVQGVPIYDVSNAAGGRTVYIAKKMEVI